MDVDRVVMQAIPGDILDNCKRQALLLACTEWRNVEFTHNDRVFTVNTKDLFAQVKEAHKTPEGPR